ncbi:MAG: type II 3-dehydroquinate dehydratase [Syntrophomonas sp.]
MDCRILVINGPNLNLLGVRETSIYGEKSLEDINREIRALAMEQQAEVSFFQSNHEGEIVDRIQEARAQTDCIIINAGAFTHYSIAIHDALRAVAVPIIEVHLSNIYTREEFRQHSLISPIAAGGIFGFGDLSYKMAFQAACEIVKNRTA